MLENNPVQITSQDFWVKVVEFLQQNWALIEEADSGVRVYFISDTSGVFDQIDFVSPQEAEDALVRNGFSRFADDPKAQEFLTPPGPPYHFRPHPNGPIYSSGRFWRGEPQSEPEN